MLPSARSRMPTSRLGGVPTVLPEVGVVAAGQLSLGLESARENRSGADRSTQPLPDVAHIREWLRPAEQCALVADTRRWALPPAGLRHPRVPTGHLMSVQSVCLGWHWQPYLSFAHGGRHRWGTGEAASTWPHRPRSPSGRRCRSPRGRPTVRPGRGDRQLLRTAPSRLHQDGEEPSDAPVVTISLGDTCVFRLAGVDRRTSPFTDSTAQATCWCSVAETGASTTASRR